jgi:quercetin dioxygenase-like cupin family protein
MEFFEIIFRSMVLVEISNIIHNYNFYKILIKQRGNKMISRFILLVLTFGFFSFALAQNPAEVSPEIYKVLLDNDDVTVLEVTFKPGQGDKKHSHKVHTFYVLQGGKVKITEPDGTSKEMEAPSGATVHAGVVTHQVTNIGDTEVKVILVEHKKLKEAAVTRKPKDLSKK